MECVTCQNKPASLGVEGLTPNRQRVYDVIARSKKPVSAYDILHKLSQKDQTAPPTVYRALEWLKKENLVHRIESLNAYLACHEHEGSHEGLFAICQGCGDVQELSDKKLEKQLMSSVLKSGFHPTRGMIEMVGLCGVSHETAND